jgi:predicted metal-dependent HD superfamily phosphohydrolase
MRSPHATVDGVRHRYWAMLAKRHAPGAWKVIDAGYGETHRGYHSWDHIDDLLLKLDSFSALAVRLDLIATAIFWHDVVYATRKADGGLRPDSDNVRDSAVLYCRHSLSNETDVAAVCDMIMATADHLDAGASCELYPGFAKDLDLFLDLDLSSLAAPWPLFAENLEKIRFEYAWVPELTFSLGRVKMLQTFLNKGDQLFRREETNRLWSGAARDNLLRCVGELRAEIARLSPPT